VSTKTQPEVVIRVATPADAASCGPICYQAFAAISNAHGFPPDVPSPEAGVGLFSMMFGSSGFYCLVAEVSGRVVGSNCLDERALIAGIGPITIDPAAQNLGVGKKLMHAVMRRAKERGFAGIRLVQAAFHNRSLSLYSNLGFDVREPLSCLQGRTRERVIPGCAVRNATPADLETCNALAQRVHGFDRAIELSEAIQHQTAKVVEREGRLTGYATVLAFFGHATAESNQDLCALIASAESFAGPGILVPSRNSSLLRWCLANELKVVQPMTLMSTGLYNEPQGSWLPSIEF
jgi:GNAT superfamily N-acetyltransferase